MRGIELRDPAAIERDRKEDELRKAGLLPPPYPWWHIIVAVILVLIGLAFLGNNHPRDWHAFDVLSMFGMMLFAVVHLDWRLRRR